MLRRSLVSSTGLSSKSSKAVIDALAKNGGSAAEKQYPAPLSRCIATSKLVKGEKKTEVMYIN